MPRIPAVRWIWIVAAMLAGFVGPGAGAEGSTLSGFVRGRADGESLFNATVAVRAGGREWGTASNEAGYYALSGLPPGTCVVTVSYIGYTTAHDTLALRADQDLDRKSVV